MEQKQLSKGVIDYVSKQNNINDEDVKNLWNNALSINIEDYSNIGDYIKAVKYNMRTNLDNIKHKDSKKKQGKKNRNKK